MGYWFAGAGVSTWVVGNGSPGSWRLSVSAGGAGIMGYLILAKYILPYYGKVLTMFGSPADLGTVVSILIVTITVIIIKSLSGRGTPLHGGLPSGHAAVAFSIATAVSLNTADPLISLLCFAMAIMVSHSRLLMRIHTMREVVLGSLVGAGLTLTGWLLGLAAWRSVQTMLPDEPAFRKSKTPLIS